VRVWLGLALIVLSATPAAARDSLGIFGDWAAFRDPASRGAPLRCYAIAEPDEANARGIYATVGQWPAARVRGQIYFRLPNALRGTASLQVGSRRFTLTARDTGLWAADARSDAAIVAAMRGSLRMRLTAGRLSASWRLRGAATAIDAAALGCVGQ
jgi:hypothetical protein